MMTISTRLNLLWLNILQAMQTWLRLPIMLVAVIVSVGLAYVATVRQMQFLLVGVLGIGGVLALLRFPPLGIVLTIVSGFTVPFLGPGGLNATVVMLIFIFGLWIFDVVATKRKWELVHSRMMLPILGLLVVSAFAFAMGQIPWFPFASQAPMDAQIGGLAIFIFSMMAFVLVANLVEDERWLGVMIGVVLLFGTIYLFGRANPRLAQLTRSIIVRQSVGGVFWAWFAPLAFSQAVFNKKLHPVWRVSLVLLVLLSIYVGFVQNRGWKSGWVPPFVALGAILLLKDWRWGLVGGVVAIVPAFSLINNALADDAYSISTRLDAWYIMYEIVKVNPILGLGFANYYWYTPLFSIRGFDVRFNSHNNYVDIVAQTGILGLVFFLWFFWAGAKVCWQLKDRVPKGSFAEAYVYGAFGGLVGTLVAAMLGDWVLPFVYNLGLVGVRTGILAWIFIGGLVVMERQYGGRSIAS